MRRGVATVLGGLLPLAALVACSGTVDDPPASATVAAVPSDGVDVTRLDSGPVGLAAVGAGLWTALPEAGTVRTAHGHETRVGPTPLRLVETPAGVWVSVIGNGTLVRIDPGTGDVDLRVRVRPAGSEPEGLAFDGETLWVVDQAGDRVLPMDPETGRFGTAVEVGAGPRLVATGPDGVYVSSYVGSSVTRVVDGRPTTAPAGTCTSPQDLTEAGGVLWVACTTDGRVVGLDATTLQVVAELPDLPAADAVVADGDRVYVVGQRGPTVWTVDTASREVAAGLVLDGQERTGENVDAVIVRGHLWVSHPEARRLYDVPLTQLG
jgi:hypothetical protein